MRHEINVENIAAWWIQRGISLRFLGATNIAQWRDRTAAAAATDCVTNIIISKTDGIVDGGLYQRARAIWWIRQRPRVASGIDNHIVVRHNNQAQCDLALIDARHPVNHRYHARKSIAYGAAKAIRISRRGRDRNSVGAQVRAGRITLQITQYLWRQMKVFTVSIAFIVLVVITVIFAEIHHVMVVIADLIRVDIKVTSGCQNLRVKTNRRDIQAQHRRAVMQAFARIGTDSRKLCAKRSFHNR